MNINEFVSSAQEHLETVHRESCAELARRVIARTPVDTGELRDGWRAILGGAEQSDPVMAARGLQLGQGFTVVNGLGHANPVEYGGVGRAAVAMVRTSALEWSSIVGDANSRSAE